MVSRFRKRSRYTDRLHQIATRPDEVKNELGTSLRVSIWNEMEN
jgi:hypothetical protein